MRGAERRALAAHRAAALNARVALSESADFEKYLAQLDPDEA